MLPWYVHVPPNFAAASPVGDCSSLHMLHNLTRLRFVPPHYDSRLFSLTLERQHAQAILLPNNMEICPNRNATQAQ
jgi:hypothetical protein